MSSERTCGELDEAGAPPNDVAEGRTRDIAVDRTGAIELRMIEHVESLEPQLEAPRLAEPQTLDQREVEVLDAGAIEEAPRRIAELSERRQAKTVRVGLERRV